VVVMVVTLVVNDSTNYTSKLGGNGVVLSAPCNCLSETMFNSEHDLSELRVSDLHHIEDASSKSLALEAFSLASQASILFMLLVLESSDLDGLGRELGVETVLEQSTDWNVIDTGLDTVAQTFSYHVLRNIDNSVDHSTVVGDQNLSVVGTEDFNVVALLQDGTTVGEFSI